MNRPAAMPVLDVFNPAVEHRPDDVVAATSTDHVAEVLRHAAATGQRVHTIGTGHGLPHGIQGGIAITTAALAGVTVDPEARTARVGAGTRWADVIGAAADHGLAPVCGSAPGVGVVGMLLGGGLGPVGRTFGWASDHVRSFEVVTGSGDLVTASASSHPDLFRLLRGGKRVPGVVTSVELELQALGTVYGGGLFFGADDAERVLIGFAEWSADLPDAVTASCALLRLPDLEHLPEPLRGRFVVHLRIVVVGGEELGSALVAPLRALGTPILDTLTEMPFAAIGSIHADPLKPMPVLDGGVLLHGFDAEAARALLAVAGPAVDVPFTLVEVRVLGGALGREPSRPDAVVGRSASHHLFVVSVPAPPLFPDVIPAAARGVVGAMAPWSTGGVQPNFLGSLNAPDAFATAWPTEVRLELDAVRAAHDPACVLTPPPARP